MSDTGVRITVFSSRKSEDGTVDVEMSSELPPPNCSPPSLGGVGEFPEWFRAKFSRAQLTVFVFFKICMQKCTFLYNLSGCNVILHR